MKSLVLLGALLAAAFLSGCATYHEVSAPATTASAATRPPPFGYWHDPLWFGLHYGWRYW